MKKNIAFGKLGKTPTKNHVFRVFFFFFLKERKRKKNYKANKIGEKNTVFGVFVCFCSFFLFGESKYFSMRFPLLIEIVLVSSDALHLVIFQIRGPS